MYDVTPTEEKCKIAGCWVTGIALHDAAYAHYTGALKASIAVAQNLHVRYGRMLHT